MNLNDISTIKLGSQDVKAIYKGNEQIWPSYLLNQYSGAAVAYSLRKLSSDTTNVVRVRRSSDNVEQDFTAGEVTDGTLTTFTGANDGFVTIWYDQSGNNNDIYQNTASNQPQIVNAGNLNLLNGKPLIKRVSSNASMIGDYAPNGNNRQLFFVGEMNYAKSLGLLIGSKTGGGDYNMANVLGNSSSDVNNNSTLSSERLNNSDFSYSTRNDIYNSFLQQRLLSYNVDFYFDDNSFCFGYRPLSTIGSLGMYDMQELILFDTLQDTDAIETKINGHYNIY